MTPLETTQSAKVMRLMNLALTLGLSLMAVVFVILRRTGRSPALDIPPVAGTALTGAAIAMLAVAIAVVRPRIPLLAPDQTADQYWGDATVRMSVIMLWAGVEGAGLMGAVGYLLTGQTAPGVALVLAILTLVSLGPARFEGDAG